MASSLPSPHIHTPNNDDQSKTNLNKYTDIISTLPREPGWDRFNDFYQFEGFWYYEKFLRGIMSVQQHFRAKPSDIIVAAAQKTGTTWLKALTFAIVTRKRFDDSTSPLLVKVPHACFPYLEIDLVEKSGNTRDPEIPLISTHIPYTSLPKSIVQEGCKIIYIWRDAKDTFVSFWHFIVKLIKSSNPDVETISLEEAFELFCRGVANHGPYWDHVLGYWKARLENPDKVLFLKYEEMMKDTGFYVKILAEFMGYPITMEEEENGVVQKIVDMCSFEKLSKLEVNKSGHHQLGTSKPIENTAFFRKGKIGDWSDHMTVEMGSRLNFIMENKLKGSSLAL